jgi:hypothetical protein
MLKKINNFLGTVSQRWTVLYWKFCRNRGRSDEPTLGYCILGLYIMDVIVRTQRPLSQHLVSLLRLFCVTEGGKRQQLGSVSISGKIFSSSCAAYGDFAHCMSFCYCWMCDGTRRCGSTWNIHIFMQSHLTDGVRNGSYFLQWDFIVLTHKGERN